ncbi:aminoglycoside 3'-phosphotransferase [Geobacillus sp. BMUD]|uniref:APH(3') family aminoglycoside O-phosphotransferase n=1 Tax=Geobacillus TaxID=129337 RepID=UPI00068B67F9|nr:MULTISPECIES: APH(3') family aminoglycoside O-phosphotransferase [Geobacillus]NNU82287.1 aminoglycoside 3'-phosphotransferase [Geobacillus sp. BMUD]
MIDLPDKIKSLIHEEEYSIDDVGMSGSTVVLFKDKVLKIQTISEEAENEYYVMEWLQGKLPVPKVLGYEKDEKKTYFLMTKVPGEMACADKYLKDPEQLTTMLAEGVQMLWNVDIRNCPYSWNLEKKLQMAKYRVENNLVDIDDAEPGTFGENGFQNPHHLLEWLNKNKPEEELVLSHGDFCLPNIFLANGKVSGYIDLGRAGIADKWQDIALCYRSLLHNLNGKYTGKQHQGFYADMLFEKLGLEPNWDKIRYYILLDELF